MTNLISADEKKDRNLAFGVRLKAHRQELKITQEELAESVGKSSETISKLERGLVYPGVDMLILLAERLDASLDSLVGIHSTISISKKQSALVAQAASQKFSFMRKRLLKTLRVVKPGNYRHLDCSLRKSLSISMLCCLEPLQRLLGLCCTLTIQW